MWGYQSSYLCVPDGSPDKKRDKIFNKKDRSDEQEKTRHVVLCGKDIVDK